MNMKARMRGVGMTSVRTRKRLIVRLRDSGIRNELVLQAMIDMPRHMFVDEALETRAYEDCALPIGEGQTISQPYVVALMTQLLLESNACSEPDALGSVLEIGTGSGYQAAILSRLIDRVYTVERVRSLAHRCSKRFGQLGIRNISSRYADGFEGWASDAPFDAVVVTAAMETVPAELLQQLRPGGVLIGPVGPQQGVQQLSVVRVRENLEPQTSKVAAVRFVPFLGGLC